MPRAPLPGGLARVSATERFTSCVWQKMCIRDSYNMVRILAGTLCEVGAGRMQPDAIPGILASRDRSQAGPTLPAKGLFLEKVDYDL